LYKNSSHFSKKNIYFCIIIWKYTQNSGNLFISRRLFLAVAYVRPTVRISQVFEGDKKLCLTLTVTLTHIPRTIATMVTSVINSSINQKPTISNDCICFNIFSLNLPKELKQNTESIFLRQKSIQNNYKIIIIVIKLNGLPVIKSKLTNFSKIRFLPSFLLNRFEATNLKFTKLQFK
jgi:hypothetical protein